MKSILISLVILTLVGALAGGGLFAFFSDTETSNNNTFQAGTIDITLSGDVGLEMHGSVTLDWKPCQTAKLDFVVKNEGMNPADVWKLISYVNCTGGAHPGSEDALDPDNTINDISGIMRFGMTVDIEEGIGTPVGDSTKDADYPITESENYTVTTGSHELLGVTTGVYGKYIYVGRLAPGDSFVIQQTFHMDGATGNWAQGDLMSINEDYYALQVVGNPPLPYPQLPPYAK